MTRCWGLGGGQVWAHEFSNHLADRGHDVRVVYLHSWWPGISNGVPNDVVDVRAARYRQLHVRVPLFLEACWLAGYLSKHLKLEKVDVIVSTGAEAGWLNLLRLFRPLGAPPQVATVHHSCSQRSGLLQIVKMAMGGFSRRRVATLYQRWDEYLDRLSMGRADVVVCFSRDQSARVVTRFNISRAKVRMLYCGTDIRRLEPGNGTSRHPDPVILHAGGLAPSKGLPTLLDAFARIRHQFPGARIDVLGGGDWRYEATVKALGLSGLVRFYGNIPHEEMVRYYREAYMLAAPTEFESFGLILAEAMACGLPVVATRVMSVPEVVEEGVTGLLVPVGDPGALADALASLLSDPERAAAMGRAGRARAEEHFAWDKIIPHWEQLLVQVADRGEA